jgi:hypothetical protein
MAVQGAKKKGLPGWAIALIVVGGVGVIAVVFIVVFVFTLALGSLGDTPVTQGDEAKVVASKQAEDKQERSGMLGDYAVTIKECKVTKTYDGKAAVIITYEWTNNSDEAKSFSLAFEDKVYQNGVECTDGILGGDAIEYGDVYADVKPGVTFAVQAAYELQDESTPVDVELKEMSLFPSDKMVYKQFAVK